MADMFHRETLHIREHAIDRGAGEPIGGIADLSRPFLPKPSPDSTGVSEQPET